MNWASVSFDWNQVRAFLATVEEGSLTAAARALGLTQPTLGRQVAALEAALGVVLFERLGKSLSLTPTGMDLLEHVRAMGNAATRISLAASGRAQAIEGNVCITASDGISAYVLPGLLQRLRDLAPGITVDVVASNTIRDLQQREADIAIRHVRPEQPDLIARLLRETTGHIYGATEYLDRHGRPRTMADLSRLDFIGFQPIARFLVELQAVGLPVRSENFKLTSDSGVAVWEMVRQGLGLGAMVRDIADLAPGVEAVLPDKVAVPIPIWLTTHREMQSSRRIRVVYEFLAEALGAAPS